MNPKSLKTLDQIIKGFPILDIQGPSNPIVQSICYDSRRASSNTLFVAIRGENTDGERFIGESINNGATIIIAESSYSPSLVPDLENITYIQVQNCREALSYLSSQFYDKPSKKLKLFGVTGTNGKTTVVYLLESIFEALGNSVGVIGTVNSRFSGKARSSSMTTPESLNLNRVLSEMVENGIDYCFLEVSSHALAMQRVDNLEFETILFTNLTRDHLDFHPTFEDYKETKKSLFKKFPNAKAVVNIDDFTGLEIVNENTSINFFKTSVENEADIRATDIRLTPKETQWTLRTTLGNREIRSKLLGLHNVYNQLTAAAGAFTQKVPLEIIVKGLEKISNIPGRFESIDKGQPFSVIVDYAHTDDALTNILRASKTVTKSKVILVFGCGGDRDRGKRPRMGEVAITGADQIIVTSDNPRTEDPDKIIDDICRGFPENAQENTDYIRIPDRRKAIEYSIKIAQPGDLILIAGKGHENYQVLSTETIPFDDREIASSALDKRLENP